MTAVVSLNMGTPWEVEHSCTGSVDVALLWYGQTCHLKARFKDKAHATFLIHTITVGFPPGLEHMGISGDLRRALVLQVQLPWRFNSRQAQLLPVGRHGPKTVIPSSGKVLLVLVPKESPLIPLQRSHPPPFAGHRQKISFCEI